MYFLMYRKFHNSQIIRCGSDKSHIHSLALNIFNLTFDHNIVVWVGRENNKEVDKILKTIDFDDWYTTQHLNNILEQVTATGLKPRTT